jgi:hypothetical protein
LSVSFWDFRRLLSKRHLSTALAASFARDGGDAVGSPFALKERGLQIAR